MNSLESKNDSFLSSHSDSDDTPHLHTSRKPKNENATKSGFGANDTDKGQSLTSKSSAFQSDFEDDMIFAKYHFYWFCKPENNKMYSVLVELQHQCGVKEAIQQVLPYFNQELDKKTKYKLAQDPDLYELYSAKKSGQPKLDYPALDGSQNLNQTMLQNFCLVEKNAGAILRSETQENIRLVTIIENEKEFESSTFTQQKSRTQDFMVSMQPMPGQEKAQSLTQQKKPSATKKAENEEVETYCCCLQKPKKQNNALREQGGLVNETTLTDPLLSTTRN